MVQGTQAQKIYRYTSVIFDVNKPDGSSGNRIVGSYFRRINMPIRLKCKCCAPSIGIPTFDLAVMCIQKEKAVLSFQGS